VELKVFKEDNGKMKKAQEDQLEINEMMLRSIVIKNTTKDNEKEEEVSKRSSKNSSHEKKNENNFSEDTHMEGNRTTT
jgi:ribosomal protein S6